MKSRLRIVVTGLIAQHPTLGGLTWHYLNYVLGLARLGHDVYYLEDSGQWPYTTDGGESGDEWIARDAGANVDYLQSVLSRFGLGERWAYRFPTRPQWFGLSDKRRGEVISSADLLINVSGSLEHPGNYRNAGRLAYVDTDPVFTQIKIERGETDFASRVAAHDVHFTFGESLREPFAGYDWLPTRQPVALDEWSAPEAARPTFTTVMNWTSYEPIVYESKTYGQKDAEFIKFLDLPARVAPLKLEVALSNIEHVNWATENIEMPPSARDLIANNPSLTPRELLAASGWNVVNAAEVCGNLDLYRDYVRGSMAEWSIAKHGYMVGRPGWFSDRSACFLAAGRPVVVENTGIDSVLPLGRGILAFDTAPEAVEAIREVAADTVMHGSAARDIAHEYFDSGVVLTSLLDRAANAPGAIANANAG